MCSAGAHQRAVDQRRSLPKDPGRLASGPRPHAGHPKWYFGPIFVDVNGFLIDFRWLLIVFNGF